ncbi:MAG TPA: M56 family metallopeptidase [Kofleriaceae bacterium]|nr:M56 family metallopeptidase [Kofleriaceae bacterium]
MSSANAAAAAVVDWLSLGLLHGTALALLTALAAATLLRRARPALHAALWAIVLVKFLVPVGPGASFSLSSVLERALGAAGAPAAAAGDVAGAAPETAAASAGPDLLLLALAAAYLAGVAWVAARRTRRRRALLRSLAGMPLASAELAARVAAAARRLRLARVPAVRVDDGAAGPYLVGRLRPVLVLPAWLDPASPAWAAAVAHELAHLRRRDPWLGAVEALVTLAFWFWPPALWARARLDRAREMACDQWALRHGPLSPRAYAHFLVEVALRRARGASAAEPSAALALLRRRGQLVARVDHLLAGARPAGLGRRPAAAAAAWALLCLAGASRTSAAAPAAAQVCSIEPELLAQILASSPDADADRDGVLTQDEACAHQLRVKQRLIEDAELMSRIDPADELFLDTELCSSDRCKEELEP